jgi:predicted secreted acid phosphatase
MKGPRVKVVVAWLVRAALCGVLVTSTLSVAWPADAAVSKSEWLADVHQAMAGSRAYLRNRLDHGAQRLAINLDIDNTALATYYDPGQPVRDVRRLARFASRHGVAVLFNTARPHDQALAARRRLRSVGYEVSEICWRGAGEGVAHSKRRCRRHFVREGYDIAANVGNRRTDFVGGNYGRAFRLPNYGNSLS